MTIDPNELARIFDELSHHDPDSSDPMIRNAHALRREVERLRERNGLNELADALSPLVEHVKEHKAEIDRLRATLVELDAHVAWYLTGTEHEHDAESPFSRAIERHRALGGGAPCATCGGKRLDKSDVTRVLAGKVAVGGGELAAWTACPTCGGSGVAS